MPSSDVVLRLAADAKAILREFSRISTRMASLEASMKKQTARSKQGFDTVSSSVTKLAGLFIGAQGLKTVVVAAFEAFVAGTKLADEGAIALNETMTKQLALVEKLRVQFGLKGDSGNAAAAEAIARIRRESGSTAELASSLLSQQSIQFKIADIGEATSRTIPTAKIAAALGLTGDEASGVIELASTADIEPIDLFNKIRATFTGQPFERLGEQGTTLVKGTLPALQRGLSIDTALGLTGAIRSIERSPERGGTNLFAFLSDIIDPKTAGLSLLQEGAKAKGLGEFLELGAQGKFELVQELARQASSEGAVALESFGSTVFSERKSRRLLPAFLPGSDLSRRMAEGIAFSAAAGDPAGLIAESQARLGTVGAQQNIIEADMDLAAFRERRTAQRLTLVNRLMDQQRHQEAIEGDISLRERFGMSAGAQRRRRATANVQIVEAQRQALIAQGKMSPEQNAQLQELISEIAEGAAVEDEFIDRLGVALLADVEAATAGAIRGPALSAQDLLQAIRNNTAVMQKVEINTRPIKDQNKQDSHESIDTAR